MINFNTKQELMEFINKLKSAGIRVSIKRDNLSKSYVLQIR
jgi:hypothetical protein